MAEAARKPNTRNLTPRQAAILRIVREHPGADTGEIARLAGCHTADCVFTLVTLQKRVLVGRQQYALPGHYLSTWYPEKVSDA